MTKDRRTLKFPSFVLALALALAVARPVLGQAGTGQPSASSQTAKQPGQGSASPASQTPADKPAPAAQMNDKKPPQPQTASASKPTAPGPSADAMQSFQDQMRDLQEQADRFSARAKTTQAALGSIKAQMADMGLDLRLDVREAETRMTYLLDKARQEILSGDAVSAEADLQMAGYAAEFIERFLGR